MKAKVIGFMKIQGSDQVIVTNMSGTKLYSTEVKGLRIENGITDIQPYWYTDGPYDVKKLKEMLKKIK